MLKNMDEKKKAIFSLCFRVVCVIAGIFGIIYHMFVNSLLDTGFMVKHNLAYFTLQTNIFCVVIFLVLLIKTLVKIIKEHKFEVAHINSTIHLACTMYITVTMLGYWLALTPMSGLPQNTVLWIDGVSLHALTPILAIVDCLLFLDHGKVNFKDIPKWLIYPICYYISIVVISKVITEPYYTIKFGGKVMELMYPYPFFDSNIMGIWGVVIAVAVACVFFVLFSMLYIFVDKKIAKN